MDMEKMDPRVATKFDGPMPDDAPFWVAHYGMDRTVFTWRDGDKVEAEGYCEWRKGHIVKAFG